MTGAADAVRAVIASGRGERPASLDNTETEQVLTIALALLVELSVSNERIQRLEREVAALREILLGTPSEPAAAVGDAGQDALEALQLRVLRIMIDPRTRRGA